MNETDHLNARVLIIDDDRLVRNCISERLLEEGFSIDKAQDAYKAIEYLKSKTYEVALLDIRMPGMNGIELLEKIRKEYPMTAVIIISGHGTMDTAIQALRLGASDFLTKPVGLQELINIVKKTLKTRHLISNRQVLARSDDLIKTISGDLAKRHGIVGESRWSHKVRNRIRLVAEAKCNTVLITGETGTGKEVVARTIHEQFIDTKGPFIAVSCPALPDSLVESELFGHVKGAFTGAMESRKGCFELANGGTLFLDEIGDLSLSAQAKILRALETRAIRKVGDATEVAVDVRIIAATNIPLLDAVEVGRFRRDLYYRLSLFLLETEPLRNRRDDIIPLAYHFLRCFSLERNISHPGITPEAERALLSYDFPGNVRELKNIVERALIMSMNDLIRMEHIEILGDKSVTKRGELNDKRETESDKIMLALEQARWNRREAAQILNMPYSTLRYKMEKLGIK